MCKHINGYTIINCCPHIVRLQDSGGVVHEIPQDEKCLVRVKTTFENGSIAGFDDNTVLMQYIESLPPRIDKTIYIVSNPAMQIIKRSGIRRDDFRALGKKVVDDKGNTVSVGLIRL